jgi:hypothetical protein
MAEPNLFHLSGHYVSVDYTTTGIEGTPRLHYQDSTRSLQFQGDEIESVPTEAGTIVSVTIARTVDVGFTSFSVLLPRVNVEPPQSVPSVHTVGITTIHRSSLGPPLDRGQRDTYTVVHLVGTAQTVETLAPGS